MRGKQESEESIRNLWMAIKTVTERPRKRGAASRYSNFASVALLAGVAFELEVSTSEIESLIEASTKMEWEAMRDVSVALFEFFVKDPACKGQLQDLWKNRITLISWHLTCTQLKNIRTRFGKHTGLATPE